MLSVEAIRMRPCLIDAEWRINASKFGTIIGWDNELSHFVQQAIIWANAC